MLHIDVFVCVCVGGEKESEREKIQLEFLRNLFFLRLFPCTVVWRMLKPILVAFRQRRGTLLNRLPAHHRVLSYHMRFWYLAQVYLSSSVKNSELKEYLNEP